MQSTCHVCEKAFEVRFRYQVREEDGQYVYVCSTGCQQSLLLGSDGVCVCDICGRTFEVEYPYQMSVGDGRREYFCSTDCRERSQRRQSGIDLIRRAPKRIAVFNHKGGTGKTTTAINLAAGMAEAGRRVLLIDADGQGNVGASLGIAGQRTLYHVLVNGAQASDVAVPVREGLEVLTSNETLAAAELFLAERPNRDRIMRERLGDACSAYDTVVIDCAPALSLMNQNAMVYADSVVVPVACDYLSLVGVKQVLRTIRNVSPRSSTFETGFRAKRFSRCAGTSKGAATIRYESTPNYVRRPAQNRRSSSMHRRATGRRTIGAWWRR